MKRLVFVLAMILSLALLGCEVETVSQNEMTHAVETLTVMAYTLTPVNTPHPNEKPIVELINGKLQEPGDPLSMTIDASYTVERASLVPGPGQKDPTILSVGIRCECPRDGSCCNVEHTFVVMTNAMAARNIEVIAWIPLTIVEIQMTSYDHDRPIGTISLPWTIMQEYLLGHIDGYQLGGAVRKDSTPVP